MGTNYRQAKRMKLEPKDDPVRPMISEPPTDRPYQNQVMRHSRHRPAYPGQPVPLSQKRKRRRKSKLSQREQDAANILSTLAGAAPKGDPPSRSKSSLYQNRPANLI